MQRRIIVVILLLISTPLFTVAANTEGDSAEPLGWINSAGGPFQETVGDMIIMDDGRIVVAGSFSGNIMFEGNGLGATDLQDNQDIDMFVATMNNSGNWTEIYSFGSTGNDGIDSLALHPSGDLIIAGHFCIESAGEACTLNFTGGHTFSKESDEDEGDAFVGRFTFGNGILEPIWVRVVPNQGPQSAFDIEISNNGDIALGILYNGELEVGNETFFGGEGLNLVIISYDENGALRWANGVSSPLSLEPFGALCYDQNNYLYVTGTFIQSLFFPDSIESIGGADIFLIQLDDTGNYTWITSAGGSGDDWVTDCIVDNNNKIRLVGQFDSTATFGEINVTSNGWWDLFHAKVNTNGEWDSIVTGGGTGWDSITSIAIDERDNAYLSGFYSESFTLGSDLLPAHDSDWEKTDILIAQLDADEQWSWALSAGGNGDDDGLHIAMGENETPIIASTFSETAIFSNQTLHSQGEADIAIWLYARDYDSDGFIDGSDNCPKVANPNQIDTDNDLWGDACDPDDDGDGVGDEWDDCSPGETGWYADSITDFDSDGCKDSSEDFDDDEDGILDDYDECQKGSIGWISTIENDEDQNGCEDVDSDGDGWVDQLDVCPDISDNQADLDNDGIGDACENDTDGDGIEDEIDSCMLDNFVWISDHSIDYDQDGCRDEDRDTDDDNDGVLDFSDSCPLGEINWDNSDLATDHDSDGCSDDYEDIDDDDDTYPDVDDNCPKGIVGIAGTGMDLDQDGCLDSTEDDDDDNDGVNDTNDQCKYTPKGLQVDINGCSGSELDDDNDGIANNIDLCPASEIGDIVSSTGCVIEDESKQIIESDEDEDSIFVNILFIISGLLIILALYLNFKPEEKQPDEKNNPPAIEEETESLVDD
ncbi:MAG: thrombospondin type 3 repeat-containing protein [Candidatus Poseidoniaceae archaeon]|nr:thrombospondin type 3 repeat-containing protein [Candidatus Poseidoniaceae archaeon]